MNTEHKIGKLSRLFVPLVELSEKANSLEEKNFSFFIELSKTQMEIYLLERFNDSEFKQNLIDKIILKIESDPEQYTNIEENIQACCVNIIQSMSNEKQHKKALLLTVAYLQYISK
ncbi:hypothetical protein V9L05_20460 [Bernardetia sp. Wsw4-3y2]|uniref:hypothetical protein n=1 Tax=Bernardetia sp. Wsw4-3y2 TaxID=3127471 RepID=UPI0030CDFAC8